MSLMIMTSAAGSPGVTTLGLGLALVWPRSVLLVDADPGAPQAVLAGYFRGQRSTGKGLLRVAEAHRDRRPLREVVMDQTISLVGVGGQDGEDTDTVGQSRLFLPGFAKPGSASLFAPVWPELADTFHRLGEADIDVLVDVGRLTAAGLPEALVSQASGILMITRTSLRAVAATRVQAAPLQQQCAALGVEDNLGLVLIGEGKPYTGKEISPLLGLPVVASVADDQTAAAHLSDGARRPRKFSAGPLPRSLHHCAAQLDRRARAAQARVEQVA